MIANILRFVKPHPVALRGSIFGLGLSQSDELRLSAIRRVKVVMNPKEVP